MINGRCETRAEIFQQIDRLKALYKEKYGVEMEIHPRSLRWIKRKFKN